MVVYTRNGSVVIDSSQTSQRLYRCVQAQYSYFLTKIQITGKLCINKHPYFHEDVLIRIVLQGLHFDDRKKVETLPNLQLTGEHTSAQLGQ